MSKTKQKTRVAENLNLLLASFALAFLIWVFAKAGETQDSRLVIKVEVANSDPRIEAQIEPASMPVHLRYGKEAAEHISSENFRFQVDTADLREKLGVEWSTKSMPLSVHDLFSAA